MQGVRSIAPVCSTWLMISRSELLWQNLARRIWNVRSLERGTWREEYIYRHRTASNFRVPRYIYTTLQFVAPEDDNNNNNNNDGLVCRRLALSTRHIAAGFSNGAVRLFHLPSRLHVSTFYPQHRDRLGRFSSAVSGIILSDYSLVFATVDGDIHAAVINGITPLRRAHLGDVVNDGALVDFAGSSQWWVGLFAGVPGRAFHIWNGETEELVFVGGTLTDPEAVMGWHLLTELTDLIGRVRVTCHESAVACTNLRVIVFDLRNQGVILGEEEIRRGIMVGMFDANDESAMVVDGRGVASIRRAENLDEVCRFPVRGAAQHRGALGSVNGGYAVVFVGGVIRVWEIENGRSLYNVDEMIGECDALIVDERYVAASSGDGIIHVWDFGAQ
ncbi:transcriptional regulator STERILE APETALA isoform X2 [Andrographis paniculata]|uniref:transcriptional regulator STERILE APETALA isoform X2 n=1 Tax=Andrographis paniculata TaxID=175694 RepID=UPI0021E8B40B|nr:transcriptional regulator STERILE APETALA isoform X2 [Andrographis paniculata]